MSGPWYFECAFVEILHIDGPLNRVIIYLVLLGFFNNLFFYGSFLRHCWYLIQYIVDGRFIKKLENMWKEVVMA